MSGCSSDSAHSGCSSGSAHSSRSSGSAHSALQCHFTWELSCSRSTLLRLMDKLIDICPSESAPWRGQSYNLQGFLQATLGRSSEALSLFRSASEALRGPGLLVNYGDLAWLHHERGEQEQSREYLSRVEALSREHPTEGEHPEVLAEKAWTLMKLSPQQKLRAAELFEEALEQEPERAEWRSSQVIAIANANKHNRGGVDDEALQKMQRAHEDDPENLYVSAEYLCQRARRGEDVKDAVDELADRIMSSANSSYSGLKVVLRFYRQIDHVDGAIFWADEALERHPQSRYVIRCAALCYKWRVLFQKDGASQRRLLDKAVSLLQQVIELYPDSALVKEMDLADLYSKSERRKAEEMYKRLLQMQMAPPEKQMLYNRYAKFLLCQKQDPNKATTYHKRAVLIDHDSYFRENSLTELQKLTNLSRESILAEAQSSPQSARLQELQCHFTWELHRTRAIMFSVRDRLEDLLPHESAPWRGQSYNLQGFLQATLGRSSEALSLFRSASEALRGPGLLVNYGDLAWLHHERGEQEQSREYLSRVEALSREHPTEGEHPEVLAEKAFSLMEFYNDRKPLAAELFEAALEQEPERVEWLSAQALALVSAKRHRETTDQELVIKMKRALEQDPDNLELRAEYLYQEVRRERSTYRGQSARTGAQLRALAVDLGARLLESPVRVHRGVRAVLELQRGAVSVEAAVGLAESALQKCPDSRYLKALLASCLKWQMDRQKESASQELIEGTAALLREVISLYPDSCLRNQIDLANVLAKSNHSLPQADRLYQDLLRLDLEPVSKQMLYNNYAKFMKYDKQDYVESIELHLKAAEIPVRSYFRDNSITLLKSVRPRNHRLRKKVEDFLSDILEP